MGDGFQAELAVHFLKVCFIYTLFNIYIVILGFVITSLRENLLSFTLVIVVPSDISLYILLIYFSGFSMHTMWIFDNLSQVGLVFLHNFKTKEGLIKEKSHHMYVSSCQIFFQSISRFPINTYHILTKLLMINLYECIFFLEELNTLSSGIVSNSPWEFVGCSIFLMPLFFYVFIRRILVW